MRALAGTWGEYRFHRLTLQGHRLALGVLPTVYYPTRTDWSSCFLAPHLAVEPGAYVWDLGTGTGILSLLAAKMGARVVATDINPAAVRCARLNAALNGVAERVETRQGDLFAPVAGERFDCVLANFPFYALPSRTPDEARYSLGANAQLLRRFAAGITGHLKPGAAVLFVFSENPDTAFFLETLKARGLRVQRLAVRPGIGHRGVVCRATFPG